MKTPSNKATTTTASSALKRVPQADPSIVDLSGHQPPIDTLDKAMKDLKGVRQLSLSTNAISAIQNIPENVVVLSLGRNALKRLEGIQASAASLEQYVAESVPLTVYPRYPLSSHMNLRLLHYVTKDKNQSINVGCGSATTRSTI